MELNTFGYPIIARETMDQFFGARPDNLSKDQDRLIRETLRGLDVPLPVDYDDGLYDYEIPLPPMMGDNIYEHFEKAADQFVGDAVNRMDNFTKCDVPKFPRSLMEFSKGKLTFNDVEIEPGWTRISFEDWSVSQVDNPLEDTIIFDTETFVQYHNYPIMGTAVSDKAYYLWLARETLHPSLPKNCWDQQDFIDIGKGKVVAGHNCVPWSSEALTKTGWKSLKELNPLKDEILTVNNDTLQGEWSKFKKIDGGIQQCYVLENERFRVESTLEHRWLVNNYKRKDSKYKYVTTKDLLSDKPYSILTTLKGDYNDLDNTLEISPTEAAILGWIWGDGNWTWDSTISITQSYRANPGYVNEITNLLDKSRVPYHINECGPNDFCKRFVISSYDRQILDDKLDGCRSYEEIILRLSHDALTSWLDAIWKAEGVKGKGYLSNICQTTKRDINKSVINCVQIASLRLGRRSWYIPSDNYCGKIITSENQRVSNRTGKKFENGLKSVGCVQTDNSNWVMRQGNYVTVTGNCSFDRVRTQTPYSLEERHDNLWFDTLSFHVCVAGLASGQRYFYALKNKNKEDLTNKQKKILRYEPSWSDQGTTNSLVKCFNHHVAEWTHHEKLTESDKKVRDLFVTAKSMKEIYDNLKKLVVYALDDAYYTFLLNKHLWPKYRDCTPSLTAIAGHVYLLNSKIPLINEWNEWITECETIYDKLQSESANLVTEICHQLYSKWIKLFKGDLDDLDFRIRDDGYGILLDSGTDEEIIEFMENNPVLKDELWDKKNERWKSTLFKNKSGKFTQPSINIKVKLYSLLNPEWCQVANSLFKGDDWLTQLDWTPIKYLGKWTPNWYKPWIKNPDNSLTNKSVTMHLLLKLTWRGCPVIKTKEDGFCFISNKLLLDIDEPLIEKTEDERFIYKIPHKEGWDNNVGVLLSKDYLTYYESEVMGGEGENAKRVLEIGVATSYWTSIRKRVMARFVKGVYNPFGEDCKLTLPEITPNGTVNL